MKMFKKLGVVVMMWFAMVFTVEAGEPELGGYCVVCYFNAGKAVKGAKEFSAEYEGRSYYFVSEGARDAFKEAPGRFLPQYDGWCAYGVTFGKRIPVDPRVFSVVDGKLYLNKSKRVGKKFDKDQAGYIAKADGEWAKMK